MRMSEKLENGREKIMLNQWLVKKIVLPRTHTIGILSTYDKNASRFLFTTVFVVFFWFIFNINNYSRFVKKKLVFVQ